MNVQLADLLEAASPLIQSLLAAKLLVEPGADAEAIAATLGDPTDIRDERPRGPPEQSLYGGKSFQEGFCEIGMPQLSSKDEQPPSTTKNDLDGSRIGADVVVMGKSNPIPLEDELQPRVVCHNSNVVEVIEICLDSKAPLAEQVGN